jgi:hypothetical protein
MAKQAHFLRRAYRYIRYDVPEIIFPSSLPNPPGYIEPPKKTLRQHWIKINTAVQRYIDSWDSEKLQAELKRQRGDKDPLTKEEERAAAEEMRLLAAEIKNVTKDGAHTLWPHLQHIYKTRVRAYREAVNQFIEGYKEGLAEEPKEGGGGENNSSSPRQDSAATGAK